MMEFLFSRCLILWDVSPQGEAGPPGPSGPPVSTCTEVNSYHMYKCV